MTTSEERRGDDRRRRTERQREERRNDRLCGHCEEEADAGIIYWKGRRSPLRIPICLDWALLISSRVGKRIYQSVVQGGRDFPYIRVGGGQ